MSAWREHTLRRVTEWRMTTAVLPWVLVVAALKAGFAVLELEPIDLNALLSGIVAANVFLLGFLLAGTLADFKESERLPGELAASLESIADECRIVALRTGDAAASGCLGAVRDISVAVRDWLGHRGTVERALDAVRDLNPWFVALGPHTESTFVNRLKNEQAIVRRAIVRIDTIRGTSFVTAGYVVAEVSAWLLVVALLLTDVEPIGEGIFFVAVIAFLLLYMNRLIRDLDNPFEYRHGRQGAADVSLAPLERAERRLDAEERRLDAAA